MTKSLSRHVTPTCGDVSMHALALGMRWRRVKDGYDYTLTCMFVHVCLFIVELLSTRNSVCTILQLYCYCVFHPQPYIVLRGRAAALYQSVVLPLLN